MKPHKLYAVTLSNPGAYQTDIWAEFYWARNSYHAFAKAQDNNCSAEILCSALVPHVDLLSEIRDWLDGVCFGNAAADKQARELVTRLNAAFAGRFV